MPRTTQKRKLDSLPGDITKEQLIERMIRVNQAGEYGAKRIYEGQISILEGTKDEPILQEMVESEEIHLEQFNKLMVERRVRPTILSPLWHVAGFALGAGSALLGREAAMACTVAVEEVIEEQYKNQLVKLENDKGEKKLIDTIKKFREEEIMHKTKALEEGAEEAPGYSLFSGAIKTGSRIAIWLSERI